MKGAKIMETSDVLGLLAAGFTGLGAVLKVGSVMKKRDEDKAEFERTSKATENMMKELNDLINKKNS